jgi:type IV pilus assembly protein PilP
MMYAVNRSGFALLLSFMTLVVLVLGGCSSRHQDIEQWMNQQRQAATPRVMPIPKPVPFIPAAYTQSAQPDPFLADRLTKALKAQNSSSDTLLRAELNRRKEPLESLPLDALSMVGSIGKQHERQVALIKANNLIYQVRVGNYLGQDYGKITKITENAIELREIVQDSSGEWIEHNAEMQLQESQGKSR